jgi:hypothetical protein
MNATRIWFSFSLILFLCLTIHTGSAGQTDREKILKEYEAADLNKDGFVDQDEYKRFISKKYRSVDEGRDQGAEKNKPGERKGEEFIAAGKEKDHKISFKKFLNGRLRFFNEADANKDALLSLEEYTEMRMIDPVR